MWMWVWVWRGFAPRRTPAPRADFTRPAGTDRPYALSPRRAPPPGPISLGPKGPTAREGDASRFVVRPTPRPAGGEGLGWHAQGGEGIGATRHPGIVR